MVVALLLAAATVAGASARQLVWLRGCDGRGRPFDLLQLRGQVVALTFASRYTRDEGAAINNALVARANGGDLEVVSVVDLVGVPSLFQGYAKRKIAEHDQEGRIRHLIDEQGRLRRAFQVQPDKRVDILIIDRQGALRGRYTGRQQLDEAFRLIDQLRGSQAWVE
jgi:hypothetical protein